VQIGNVIVILEAMKMEINIVLDERDGAIPGVKYRVLATAAEGKIIEPNELLVALEQLSHGV
jgi:acetyl/propionyl-CoA carboxylase alpha subunit